MGVRLCFVLCSSFVVLIDYADSDFNCRNTNEVRIQSTNQFLKSNNFRRTIPPQFPVKRVSRVYDQRRKRANAFVVDSTVIGNDHETVGGFQRFVGNCHRLQRLTTRLDMSVIEGTSGQTDRDN